MLFSAVMTSGLPPFNKDVVQPPHPAPLSHSRFVEELSMAAATCGAFAYKNAAAPAAPAAARKVLLVIPPCFFSPIVNPCQPFISDLYIAHFGSCTSNPFRFSYYMKSERITCLDLSFSNRLLMDSERSSRRCIV